MVEVIGIGWRYTSDSAIEETAPVAQMMKIQLETWAAFEPELADDRDLDRDHADGVPDEGRHAAQAAGALKSRRNAPVLWQAYWEERQGPRDVG